jgi:hypothetical protein
MSDLYELLPLYETLLFSAWGGIARYLLTTETEINAGAGKPIHPPVPVLFYWGAGSDIQSGQTRGT